MSNFIIDRPFYTERIKPYIGASLIKVLTGQRRVGKSSILKKIAEEICYSDNTANIITINLEDFAFSDISTAQDLNEAITSNLVKGKKNYIFLDEVQEVKDFDKVVRSLALDESNDIYITGSNSAMLSSEIASRLAGRSIEFLIHPLTYAEFIVFHNMADDDASLMNYLRYGGMPYLRNLPLKETWDEYLSNITDAIVYRDIVSRHDLRNNDFLQRLINYLADNVGRIFTAKRISDYLKSQHLSGSVAGIQSYISYIEASYVINRVRRWDIEGKKFFEIGEKFYFEDLGIRNSIIGYRPQDIAGVLENAVYNHLSANNYDVKIGNLGDGKEIDFIATKGGETIYIQVCTTLNTEETQNREFGNLEKISDNYEKLVITLNDSFPNTHKGIKIMNLREFLNRNF